MTSPWSTYLDTLRELHQARTSASRYREHGDQALHERTAQVDEIAGRVREQERRIVDLAAAIRRPVSFRDPAPPGPGEVPAGSGIGWAEAVADLDGHLDAADSAVRELEYFAARPPLLPTWPDWARAGAVYLAWSLPNVPLNVLMWTVGSGGFTAAAWGCCFWPIAAVVAGIVTIRMAGTPRLPQRMWPERDVRQGDRRPAGSPKQRDLPVERPVELYLPLGIAVTLGTAAASIGLLWLLGAAMGW